MRGLEVLFAWNVNRMEDASFMAGAGFAAFDSFSGPPFQPGCACLRVLR